MPSMKNEGKGTTVANDLRIATSIWSRFWGLMGRRQLPEGQGLLIDPCSSIHMFFMRFPLDVIFLDKEGKVVKIVEDIKPWRMAMGGGGKMALELNSGAASQAQVEVGDKLVID